MMNTQRFELSEGSSNKFWEIWTDGACVYTRYGRIGSTGQVTEKDAGSASAAQTMQDKLIAEKTKKGYQQVGGATPKSASAKTAPTKSTTTKAATAKKASAKSVPAEASTTLPTQLRWKYDQSYADVKPGLAVVSSAGELLVFEGDQNARTVELGWKSPTYQKLARRIDMTGLAIVFHDGRPCIAASWRNEGNDGMNPACDGPGIGLFDLTGAPIAIRYFWSEEKRKQGKAGGEYDHVKLLATSLSGDRLAWKQGYAIQAATVADFVAGRNIAEWENADGLDEDWAAYDGGGVLYGKVRPAGIVVLEPGVSPKKARRTGYVPSVDDPVTTAVGLLSTERLIVDGKATKVHSAAWSAEVKDDFDIHSAVGAGDVVCMSPGNLSSPSLCFVQLSTGKVLSNQPHRLGQLVTLHLVDGRLYIMGEKQLTSMPWPGDELLANAEPAADVLEPVKERYSDDERPLYRVTVLEKKGTTVKLRVTATHPDVKSVGTDRYFGWKLLNPEAFDDEMEARRDIARVSVSLDKGKPVSERPGYLLITPSSKATATYTIEVAQAAALEKVEVGASYDSDAWVGEHELILGEMPAWKRFECREGKRAGSWQVRVDGPCLFELADEGDVKSTQFINGGAAKAEKELAKLVAKQQSKGYVALAR